MIYRAANTINFATEVQLWKHVCVSMCVSAGAGNGGSPGKVAEAANGDSLGEVTEAVMVAGQQH